MQNKSTLRTLLALSIIPGLGVRRARQLVLTCEDITSIFKLTKKELQRFEGIGEASALSILAFKDWDKVDSILLETERDGAYIVSLTEPEYPALLKQIYDPPILLWVKGNVKALSRPGVGVIGTRNATTYGKKKAIGFTQELSKAGLAIFSGLAYGIDALAHKTAVESNGITVAVLGSGVDNIYPRKHATLAKDIIKSGGAVISEFPPGTNPDAGNFPVRNRIVSGMSLGVLVIESGIQGGSMITADLALDQNREVFAVPHQLDNASGTGCNYIIKRGTAKLVQTVDDILEELPLDELAVRTNGIAIDKSNTRHWKSENLDELGISICELLEEQEYQIDTLSDELNVHTSELLVNLLNLEMKGLITQKAGKIFELK
ncbi:MAG: DNA-processing protein DprA [Balneolaceae bacterium]